MAYEQKELGGSLFRNERKTEDKHPDWQGRCKISGMDLYVSAWEKTTKTGAPFLSLSFTAVKPIILPEPFPHKPSPEHQAIDDMDSDIPF